MPHTTPTPATASPQGPGSRPTAYARAPHARAGPLPSRARGTRTRLTSSRGILLPQSSHVTGNLGQTSWCALKRRSRERRARHGGVPPQDRAWRRRPRDPGARASPRPPPRKGGEHWHPANTQGMPEISASHLGASGHEEGTPVGGPETGRREGRRHSGPSARLARLCARPVSSWNISEPLMRRPRAPVWSGPKRPSRPNRSQEEGTETR